MADLEIVDEALTAEQESRWSDTVSMLQWTAPGFTHLFYRMLATKHNTGWAKHAAVFSRKIPIAGTDGENLILNPDTFFEAPLPQRVFVVAHEVMHNMFDDVSITKAILERGHVTLTSGKTLDADAKVSNIAQDYRINDCLVESRIGKLFNHAGFEPCYDKAIGSENDSWIDIYEKIYEDAKNGKPSFDVIVSNGSGKARNNQKWAVEVAAAQALEEMARGQGNMPAALRKAFQAILEPTVSWTDHIEGLIARKVGSGGYTWNRPNRRFIGNGLYLPAHAGYGAGWIVIWADTSGSVWSEIVRYIHEFSGIIEDVRPKRLTVIWCDAHVHDVDEIEDHADLERVARRGGGGGGGTSCHPVFDWIKNNSDEAPEMFIGFTDGKVTFPDEPSFPVIWASVVKEAKYPYGDVVNLGEKGA